MTSPRILLASAVVALIGGCSSTPAPPTVIEGTVSPNGYPARPTAVQIADERGSTRSVVLSPDGRFATELPKGHSYDLRVVMEGSVVPVVFPRRSGRLDTRFAVATNGARIRLGAVRYRAAVLATGFTSGAATSSVVRLQSVHVEGRESEVEDDDEVECHDGSHGNDDNVQQQGEHVDANAAVAVPDRDPPESAAGCEDDDENEDENEDEHDGENNDHDDGADE